MHSIKGITNYIICSISVVIFASLSKLFLESLRTPLLLLLAFPNEVIDLRLPVGRRCLIVVVMVINTCFVVYKTNSSMSVLFIGTPFISIIFLIFLMSIAIKSSWPSRFISVWLRISCVDVLLNGITVVIAMGTSHGVQ